MISNAAIKYSKLFQMHQKYIDGLCNLYKDHVHKYGNPDVKLVITWNRLYQSLSLACFLPQKFDTIILLTNKMKVIQNAVPHK